jgi:hypothetical protein
MHSLVPRFRGPSSRAAQASQQGLLLGILLSEGMGRAVVKCAGGRWATPDNTRPVIHRSLASGSAPEPLSMVQSCVTRDRFRGVVAAAGWIRVMQGGRPCVILAGVYSMQLVDKASVRCVAITATNFYIAIYFGITGMGGCAIFVTTGVWWYQVSTYAVQRTWLPRLPRG